MSMQSFLTPDKLYFKQGCLPIALRELVDVYHVSRVLIITDEAFFREGRLAPVTCRLHELGLDYAVNSESFAPDAVIVFSDCINAACWNALLAGVPRILIPASVCSTFCKPCIGAEIVILDEDLIPADDAVPVIHNRILEHAWSALTGAGASDYTLAWAVQAMRTVFDGHADKSELLHAFWLAHQAFWNAKIPDEPDAQDMTAEAAEALGMTPDALQEKIREAGDAEKQYAKAHYHK